MVRRGGRGRNGPPGVGGRGPGCRSGCVLRDLVTLLEKSQPAISHQLRILRSLRLVRAHRRGRRVFYALDDDHVRVLFEQGLEHLAVEKAA